MKKISLCRLFSHPVADADSGQRLGGTDAASSNDNQPKTDDVAAPTSSITISFEFKKINRQICINNTFTL